MTTDSLELSPPASLRRRLPTLGHGLHQLRDAWMVLGKRLERGLVDDEATAWIKRWCGAGEAKLPLSFEPHMSARLAWMGKTWQVTGLEGGEIPAAWLPVLLLLHLPALRSYWRRALRSQRFAWLTKALPRVWAVDPLPPRPGTVVAGLGIADWEHLPRLLAQGSRFAVVDAGSGVWREVDAGIWPGVLAEAGGKKLMLVERFAPEPEGAITAFWHWDGHSRILPGLPGTA